MEGLWLLLVLAVAVVVAIYEYNKPASGKRARNAKGHFVKDDKSTPHINEAYADGKTPKRKRKAPVKRKAPAKRKPRKKVK